jgi:hypothetical protein
VKLPRRSDACAVQPEAPKDADVKDRIALRSQDLLPVEGSEDLAAALGVPDLCVSQVSTFSRYVPDV